MAVKLAVTPDTRWEIEGPDLVASTRAAGFVGLGSPLGRADADARAAYDEAGLRCHEIMALVITDDAERTIAYATRLAEAAQTMGAPWVNTVFRAPPTGQAAAAIRRCAAMFADVGSAMAVEFSPLGSVPGINEGLEVVEIAGSGAALMIDTWHFFLGPSSWTDLEALPAEKIAYVQFSDASDPVSEDLFAETMGRRLMPGDGTCDLDRFAATLHGRGFAGYVSVEVLSAELRTLPVPEFLQQAFTATARYWS